MAALAEPAVAATVVAAVVAPAVAVRRGRRRPWTCRRALSGSHRETGTEPVLAVGTPAMVECLRTVPMSEPHTAELNLNALRDKGIDVTV